MNLSVKPIGSQVFIKPDEKEKQTASGLIIPDNAGENPDTGVVVAIPTPPTTGLPVGSDESPITVKVGERVLFRRNVGLKITVDGQDLITMQQREHGRDNILAVIQ